MQTIRTTDKITIQEALDKLADIIDRAARGEVLGQNDIHAMRAAATHAGHAAANSLGAKFEGEEIQPKDALDWCEMLTYVADPF